MKKLTKILFILLGVALLSVFIIAIASNKKEDEEYSYEYDLSEFNEVNINDIIDMFDSKKTYVLFIGYKDCEVCASMIPYLKEAQKENNYITQYLDIASVDRTSEEWYYLVSFLTMKTDQVINDEEVTDKTYGYLLTEYGLTPTFIIIKDGKQVGGHIGDASKTDLLEWIHDKVN